MISRQCRRVVTAVTSLFAAILLTATAPAAAVEPPLPRQINVTTDSAPGWLPSEALENQARKIVMDYLAAMDSGRFADAYALLADLDKLDQPFATFSERLRAFNLQAGAVKARRIATITWTKDPSHAPAPGVYAAIDLVSRFANIDRHCGFVILYQPPAGGAFKVMREENNFLDNTSAQEIAGKGSEADVEAAWSRVSANCPNYSPDGVPVTPPPAPAPTPLPEAPASTVGYATVEAALKDLRKRPGVTIATQGGWTIATDEATKTIWSFSPVNYPAYPAVVKRQVVEQSSGVAMNMNILCEASKAACDDLVRTFKKMNEQVSKGLRRKR